MGESELEWSSLKQERRRPEKFVGPASWEAREVEVTAMADSMISFFLA